MKLARAALITLALWGVYTYRLPETFTWDPDWSRDIYEMAKLIRGDISLIGPRIAGSSFLAPYYYYFGVPAIFLGGFSEVGLLAGNSLFFAMGIGIMYIQIGPAALVLGLWPGFVEAARHPGNGYSYLPWVMVVAYAAWNKKVWRLKQALFLGLVSGVLVHFHPTTLAVLGPLLVKAVWGGRRNWWAVLAWVLPSVPLGLFELRHNFLMTRELFSGQTVSSFSGYTQAGLQSHHFLILTLGLFMLMCAGWKRIGNMGIRILLIGGLLVINLRQINLTPAVRLGEKYQAAVRQIVETGLVSHKVKFNVLSLEDESKKVVSGNQYRFFFSKYGLTVLPIENYQQADGIALFTKIGQPAKLTIWETNEFGPADWTRIGTSGEIDIYWLTKATANTSREFF